MTEYKPKRPRYPGRVLLNRTRPFEVFLKVGGGIFAVHFQVWRFTFTVE